MNDLALHVAGATVRHQSPFSGLEVPITDAPLSAAVIEEWVHPFYVTWFRDPAATADYLRPRLDRVTPELVVRFLSNFNWRPRSTAAFLAALRNFDGLTTHIGRLLLRSDVCYSGAEYSLALARFDNEEARGFLREYLDYYLRRPDLYFDQGWVLAALRHLDARNGRNDAEGFLPLWDAFAAVTRWKLDDAIRRFEERLASLHAIEANVGRASARPLGEAG